MSGQTQTCAVQEAMSALPLIATAKADSRKRSCLLYPRKRTLVRSFNYLVGQPQERLADEKAERLSLFKIDDQFKFGRGLKRQIARRLTLENAINIGGGTPENIGRIRPIRN